MTAELNKRAEKYRKAHRRRLVWYRVLGVLAAVTVGGGVLGIPGMLIGVPLASAAYRLLSRDARARGMGKSLFDMPHEAKRKNPLFK